MKKQEDPSYLRLKNHLETQWELVLECASLDLKKHVLAIIKILDPIRRTYKKIKLKSRENAEDYLRDMAATTLALLSKEVAKIQF